MEYVLTLLKCTISLRFALMQLLIASQNDNKIQEIRAIFPQWKIEGISTDLFPGELKEEGETLEQNAIQKMRQVFAKTRLNCFADDTGLEVEALNGEPGVDSAYYAGNRNSQANMDLLLKNLGSYSNRSAQFRTVIALNWKGEEHLFEGVCKGTIAEEKMGNDGFGYDPIFIPEGEDKSFAQMSMEEKNALSHRARAIKKLNEFLSKQR